MWAIRFLNGKLAGQEIPLQNGKYILGRDESCQISIPDNGISKKHAELDVADEGVIISDLGSSNGTFVNGVKTQESDVSKNDKMSLCRTTFDLIEARATVGAPVNYMGAGAQPQQQQLQHQHQQQQQQAYGANPAMGQDAPYATQEEAPQKLTLKNWFLNYANKVILPGVYKIPEVLEFKWVVAAFLSFFVVMMTALSAFPLLEILNSSVAQESKNHAESIAITLASMNADAIKNQMHSAVSVEYALRRPGVSKALVIHASNGKIIAPSEKAHTYSKIPFVNEGRKKERVSVKQLDSSTVAAMAPIQFFNSKINSYGAEAYSVVVYDTGALAFGNKRTLSLLVQNCFIALILGTLVFIFLYKMIEYPFESLNKQLSAALKDDSVNLQTEYKLESLQHLVSNINSALSRISASQENQQVTDYDRATEMNHLIEMIGYPTLGIDMESMKIQGVSANFEEETGVSTERILNCVVQNLDDQALKLNLTSLIERIQQHPYEIASDSLEFSGVEFQLSGKGIYGQDGVAYTLISFIPMNHGNEEVG